MKTLGICIGASTISIVEAGRKTGTETRVIFSRRHEGNPLQVLLQGLSPLALNEFDAIAATGRKLCGSLNISFVSEPEACEYALELSHKKGEHFEALVSCGAETFMVYALDKDLRISQAFTAGKCASGTGEFFLQQLRRMNIGMEEAIGMAKDSPPFKVSGRCSVFCKSDCTHALNKGKPIGSIVAGLCSMMANKIIELLPNSASHKIMLVGGVTENPVVIELLRQTIPVVYVPKEACYFEALGAALWAMEHKCKAVELQSIFQKQKSSFSALPALRDAASLVTFKSLPTAGVDPQGDCILGLDVGSTTTKAVVVRLDNDAIIASVYLRTAGQPVEAARKCYRDLIPQLPQDIPIVGLGVTGSGRQIAGLHALTRDIINEIIAHARAAVYFDPDVDTIFEIGGQDAKYTYLINGVPCDYAMNEACSAGTGSFLEEACKEVLGVDTEDIAGFALENSSSPNFSDQCAAFISSDIKTAMHEGRSKQDIIAGLVYSICMNYNNRVKGNRPVGKKIFMQGGVCYNKAVPLAMATLIQRHVIVPPHPGLMGAFGVALEVKERLRMGISGKGRFDLKCLAGRTVEYGNSFHCAGQGEHCDRKCSITQLKLEGKNYLFGGSCNKYYNLRFDLHPDTAKKDLVAVRGQKLFQRHKTAGPADSPAKVSIGLNLSFLNYSLLPLYYTFFETLGFRVVLPSQAVAEGMNFQGSAFCYPATMAHGMFFDLLEKKPDYILLAQVAEIPVKNAISQEPEHQSTCFILQAEPYYLRTAFKQHLFKTRLLTPIFNFSQGYSAQETEFIRLARSLGRKKLEALNAFGRALAAQEAFESDLKELGERELKHLKENPEEIAIILFGRPYNAFCKEVNLAIPHKFASRGIKIIPFDFLPYEFAEYKGPAEFFGRSLTWAFGQMLLRAASFVQQNEQLFPVYITNFSCGPDSFLLTYFRQILKDKPSLTLEIDSHTQDAGIDTRIEAFLDIVERYRRLKKLNLHFQASLVKGFRSAQVAHSSKGLKVISSDGKHHSLFDPKVHLLIPSMGDLGTEALSAVFSRMGVRATALGVPDYEVLRCGRQHVSGKECLPLILTVGSLLKYLEAHKNKDEIAVYFMPTVGGNCRFSQYNVFLQNLINNEHLRNVAILSLSSENSYMGLGVRFATIVLKAAIAVDVLDDTRNALRVLARDKEYALGVFAAEWEKIIHNIKSGGSIERQLKHTAGDLKKIPLKYPIEEAKIVGLLGEIFIRKEIFSRQAVLDRLERREIIPRVASVIEWIYYLDYLVKRGRLSSEFNLRTKTEFFIKHSLQFMYERRIKNIFFKSGLYTSELVDIKKLVGHGGQLVPLELTGEPILVIGTALAETLKTLCGVISIGPFSCLPSRVTEAILSKEMAEGKPFLSIEVDGNPLPPVLEARLEAFCLQAERTHRLMQKYKRVPS